SAPWYHPPPPAPTTEPPPRPLPRPQTDRRPPGPYRHPVHPQDRPAVGVPAPRDGLRLWHDLLAPPAAVAARRRLDETARTLAGQTAGRRPDRLVPRCRDRKST